MNRVILKTLIGKNIQEVREKSFYIKLGLVCKVLVLYIKIEGGQWYGFTTSDGINTVELLNGEPELISLNSIEDEFAYPIRLIHTDYTNCRIVDIKQYLFLGKEDECAGFYFELEKSKGFSLFDVNDCMQLTDGNRTEEDYYLLSCFHE